MKKTFNTLPLVIALLFAADSPALARDKAGSAVQPRRKHSVAKDREPNEAAVVRPPVIFALEGQTISVKTGFEARQYRVTPQTEIRLSGETVPLTSLKSGMRVNLQTAEDPSVAARIDAYDWRSEVRRDATSARKQPAARKTPAETRLPRARHRKGKR